MAEELKAVKKYLENYDEVLISYSKESKDFCSFLAMALSLSLLNLNKNARVLNKSFQKDILPLALEEKNKKENYVISLGNSFKTSSLSYQRNDKGLKIILTGQGFLSPKDVVLTTENKETLLFSLNTKNLGEIPDLPDSTFLVVNLSNLSSSEAFGQVNSIYHKKLLAEQVFDLISLFSENVPALPLLLAFLKESLISGQAALEKISFLAKQLSLKEKEVVADFIQKSASPEERAFYLSLLKMEIKKEGFWLSFSDQELKTNKISQKYFPFVMKKMAPLFLKKNDFALIWEQNSSPLQVRGVFYASNQAKINNILQSFAGAQKDNWALFKTSFRSVKEAKEEISKIIS